MPTIKSTSACRIKDKGKCWDAPYYTMLSFGIFLSTSYLLGLIFIQLAEETGSIGWAFLSLGFLVYTAPILTVVGISLIIGAILLKRSHSR